MEVSTRPSEWLDSRQMSFARAMNAWRLAIGDCQVVTDTSRYNIDTSSFRARIPVALRATCTGDVQQIVKIAQRFSVPIYPLSTGNNWGYGTSVPVRSPGAIVDLRSMNRIIHFDDELGVVTLEPGVTQGELSGYLQSHDLSYMVPVTGAGPTCSVIANALERGFGVTPITDHFGAIVSMKVVLPNGEIFESYTREFNAAGLAHSYKWGVGPYLDGLFSQSNLGIVVDASIALQAATERSGALLFVFESNDHVAEATASIRKLLITAGQNIGAINVMSRARVECMLNGNLRVLPTNRPASTTQVAKLPPGAWFGFGSVYGNKDYFRVTCGTVKKCLRGIARRIRIYTCDDIKRIRWLCKLATAVGWPHLAPLVERLEAAITIVRGSPSTFALPLAYAKSGYAIDRNDLNPARDRCGLFWYSPIIPLRRGVVGQFIDFAERTCAKYGLPAPITFTTLSPRCFASTIPILFDRTNSVAERRAKMCLEELLEVGRTLGFVPYRMGSQFMSSLVRQPSSFWSTAKVIKESLDANGVLAPGRYSFDEISQEFDRQPVAPS